MKRSLLLAVAILALAACAPTVPLSSSIEARRGSGPGDQAASPAQAAGLMRAICSSANPAATASANGFFQDADNGIFFSDRYDLSVKFTPRSRECSLVFRSTASSDRIADEITSVGGTGIAPFPNPFGTPGLYWRADYTPSR